MNVSFYNAVSGMVAYQQNMDVLAHNMANVNTNGFKPSRTAFSDILYTKMAINGDEQLQGHGVKAIGNDLDMRQGTPLTTGYPLDFAIIGEGFFAIEDPNGELSYTRNGAFNISVEGNRGYLVTADGSYVLDKSGKSIALEKKEGTDEFDLEPLSEELGVYCFENPYGLSQTDGTRFKETAKSGEATVPKATGKNKTLPYALREGTIETSSVDMSQGMTDLIMAQRAFQMNSRMVQTADQMDEVISNLR